MPRPPPVSALKPGNTLVNIVLKGDQPTGRLTTGIVAEILTRGDHPRGVKVRLVDGRVGRVQRILEGGGGTAAAAAAAAAGEQSGVMTGVGGEKGESAAVYGNASRNRRTYPAAISRLQEESAVITGSLMDFVKSPKQKRKKGWKAEEGLEGREGVGDEEGGGSRGLKIGDDADGHMTGGGDDDDGTMPAQRLLEKEFPSIDTALVAAILLDHGGDLDSARGTLQVLV